MYLEDTGKRNYAPGRCGWWKAESCFTRSFAKKYFVFLKQSLSNLADMWYPREKLYYFEVSFSTELDMLINHDESSSVMGSEPLCIAYPFHRYKHTALWASLRMSCRVHSNVLTFGFARGIYLPDFEEQPQEESTRRSTTLMALETRIVSGQQPIG